MCIKISTKKKIELNSVDKLHELLKDSIVIMHFNFRDKEFRPISVYSLYCNNGAHTGASTT